MDVCVAASTGGHITELMLLDDIWKDKSHFIVTTDPVVLNTNDTNKSKVYVLDDINSETPLHLIPIFFNCICIIAKERPKVVISTGAAVGGILCAFGKLAGAKIIWVELSASINRLSRSGRVVKYFADLFFVQWANLKKNNKRAIYLGNIL